MNLSQTMATLRGDQLPDTQTLTVRIDTEGSVSVLQPSSLRRDQIPPICQPHQWQPPMKSRRSKSPQHDFGLPKVNRFTKSIFKAIGKSPRRRFELPLTDAPEDIEKAIDTLKKALPYFSRVALQIEEEGTKRVATVTVTEKTLSSDYYFHATPLVQFNRVTGLLPAARLEVGKRRQMGPLYMWYIPSSVRTNLTRLSGDIGYGFGNRELNYRVGGDIIWGEPDISTLGVSAQIYRAANVTAPDLLPYHDNLSTAWGNLWGAPQVHNYYLSEGIEMSFRWEPVGPTHSLKLMMRAESHESLHKTTDWYIGNWSSELKARENPPITPGGLHSVTLRYDLSTHRNLDILPHPKGW